MNTLYLMKHISYQLHTPVRHFDNDGTLLIHFCGNPDFDDEILSQAALTYSLASNSPLPLIFDTEFDFCYSKIPDCDGFFLIGPIRFQTQVPLTHHFQTGCPKEALSFDAASCTFYDFLQTTLLIYNLYHSKELELNQLIRHCCIPKDADAAPLRAYSELIFQNQEYEQKHNPYSQEMREQYSIEIGDPILLKKSIEEDYAGTLGTLSKDPVQNQRYIAVVVITLATRSAIRGGLSPEIAYSLSDSYVQKIDESNSLPHIEHLMRAAEFQLANMVKEQKDLESMRPPKKENPYIEQCKDYIFSHLHNKLEVTDIAAHLCLNVNYLSELFHICEGITLKSYIRQEKTKLVKNLLTYSQYTYSEIATYLGYSSQSHLGKSFKQSTGYTPGEYRNKFGSPQFM